MSISQWPQKGPPTTAFSDNTTEYTAYSIAITLRKKTLQSTVKQRGHKPLLLPPPSPVVCPIPVRPSAMIQKPLQDPLTFMRKAGLRVEMISLEVMPAGREFFDRPYEDNYVQLYHGGTLIVHNNWLRGHEAKRSRFQRYDLWGVEGISFPEC